MLRNWTCHRTYGYAQGSQEGVLKSVFRVFAVPGNAIGTPEKSFRVWMAQSIEAAACPFFAAATKWNSDDLNNPFS